MSPPHRHRLIESPYLTHKYIYILRLTYHQKNNEVRRNFRTNRNRNRKSTRIIMLKLFVCVSVKLEMILLSHHYIHFSFILPLSFFAFKASTEKKTIRILSFVLLFTLLSFISQAFHSIHHRECLFRLQFMPFGRRFEISCIWIVCACMRD